MTDSCRYGSNETCIIVYRLNRRRTDRFGKRRASLCVSFVCAKSIGRLTLLHDRFAVCFSLKADSVSSAVPSHISSRLPLKLETLNHNNHNNNDHTTTKQTRLRTYREALFSQPKHAARPLTMTENNSVSPSSLQFSYPLSFR